MTEKPTSVLETESRPEMLGYMTMDSWCRETRDKSHEVSTKLLATVVTIDIVTMVTAFLLLHCVLTGTFLVEHKGTIFIC